MISGISEMGEVSSFNFSFLPSEDVLTTPVDDLMKVLWEIHEVAYKLLDLFPNSELGVTITSPQGHSLRYSVKKV